MSQRRHNSGSRSRHLNPYLRPYLPLPSSFSIKPTIITPTLLKHLQVKQEDMLHNGNEGNKHRSATLLTVGPFACRAVRTSSSRACLLPAAFAVPVDSSPAPSRPQDQEDKRALQLPAGGRRRAAWHHSMI